MASPRRIRKVVSLRGAALPIPQVNKTVVEQLDILQREAKSGQIAGFIFATVSPTGHTLTNWCGNAEHHSMVAASSMLHWRLMKAALDG